MKNDNKPPNNMHDDLDRILDAHLEKYATGKPRPGLETRILANLRVEEIREVPAWPKWILAGAAVALVMIAVAIAWKPGKPSHPAIANRPPATVEIPNPSPEPLGKDKLASGKKPFRKHRALQAKTVAAADPKLDQFPSPEPLTEEELALVRYLRNFPGEAVMIARAQEEFEKRIQEQSKATRDRPSSNSDQ
ncbi:MAG TPA: hypothetical protein VKV39_14260 [Candidatus Sulfotelmatobacter sp.]|nr:hypothetical protein [Candidatus Sulfotelmatobacter sp.]